MIKKCLKDHWLPVLVLFAVSFALSLTTVFSYYSRESFGYDAGTFAYMGYALTEGRALYTGAWDNKGPLLYLIQALGILIHFRYGIFLLEIVTLFLTAVLLYKTAMLFVPRWTALVCAVFCMMSLTVTLEGGNLCEEYALPFTIGAFYLISKFFCQGFELKKWEMMAVGACIGAIFMLRLNILAFLGCAVLGVIIVLVSKKEFGKLGTVTLFAFLGFVLCLLPVAIYLMVTGSLADCIESVYLGALGAFTSLPTVVVLKNITEVALSLIPTGHFQAAVLFMLLYLPSMLRAEEKTPLQYLSTISFFGLILTFLANALSGEGYGHYYISFLPVMIIPVVWFAASVEKLSGRLSDSPMAGTAACLVLTMILCSPALPKLHANIFNNLQDGHGSHYSERYMQVSDYIQANSKPGDTVQLIGDQTASNSYFRARRLAASNYFIFSTGRFTSEKKNQFAEEIMKDVLEQKPSLIMFSDQGIREDFLCHLSDPQRWNEMLAEDYTQQENEFLYIIYKRNG